MKFVNQLNFNELSITPQIQNHHEDYNGKFSQINIATDREVNQMISKHSNSGKGFQNRKSSVENGLTTENSKMTKVHNVVVRSRP
jgi:hypothetical protein